MTSPDRPGQDQRGGPASRLGLRLDSLSPTAWLLLLIAAGGALAALSVFLAGAGFIHPESYNYLPHYLSGRPFWQLVFDNRATEGGNYQARELAFVVDWVDAQFLAWCIEHGIWRFLSLSHYVFVLVGGLVLWCIGTQYLRLPPLAAAALTLLLWSSPTAQLYTSFYRSAKAGCLLAVLLTLWAWFRADRHGTWLSAVGLALAAALMPMFDKQGFIFLTWLVLWLSWQVALHRGRTQWRLLGAGLLALAWAVIYQRTLGPWLAWKIVGIPLELNYASLPLGRLLHEPVFLLKTAAGSVLMAFDTLRIPLGNLSCGLGLVALWGVWRLYRPTGAQAESRRPFPSSYAVLFLFLGVCGLFAVMLTVFPLMNSTDHRRFFYGFPILGLWLTVVGGAVALGLQRRPEWRGAIELGLLALVAGNLFALQEHRFVLRHGKYAPYVLNANRVMAALHPGSAEAASYPPALAAQLLPAAPYFDDAVPTSLREDRIFLLFRSRD